METIQRMVCTKCGKEDIHPETFAWNRSLCDECYTWKCHDRDQLNKQKDSLEKRMEKWLSICPTTYRENSTDLIDDTAFKKVTEYRLNSRGILCMGDSRMGKTTTCWRLLETLYVLNGVHFKAMTESEFSQETAKHQRNRTLDSFLNELCNTKLLFLDDIGHVSATKSHLDELYFVVEKRTSWKRPIICTTQFSAHELIERASGSSGQKTVIAILNRLKAHCEIITF